MSFCKTDEPFFKGGTSMAEHILYTRKSVFSKPAAPAQAPRPDAVRPVFRLKDPGSAVTHFISFKERFIGFTKTYRAFIISVLCALVKSF